MRQGALFAVTWYVEDDINPFFGLFQSLHLYYLIFQTYVASILFVQVSAGNAENVKDDLSGLDKAVSAVLGQRTIERNQLLVKIAKSKLVRRHEEKNEKVTKPEELVRLYDLLLQVSIFLCSCILFSI